jgi:hypothetical protein
VNHGDLVLRADRESGSKQLELFVARSEKCMQRVSGGAAVQVASFGTVAGDAQIEIVAAEDRTDRGHARLATRAHGGQKGDAYAGIRRPQKPAPAAANSPASRSNVAHVVIPCSR